jgi:hypothetical protein
MPTASLADLRVREFREDDLPAVLELLAAAFPAWPPPHAGAGPEEFFRWKHLSSPFGRSRMHLADGGRVLSFRASMPWHVSTPDGVIEGMHATDLCVHPDVRDRGVYAATLKAGQPIDKRTRALLIGTPNDRTAKWAPEGSQLLPQARFAVRPRRPLRMAARARTRHDPIESGRPAPIWETPRARDVLASPALEELLAERERPHGRLETLRTPEFLRWRYGPPLDYRAVAEEEGGRLRGLAIFRLRPRGRMWEAGVTELLVRPGDTEVARRLLRAVARTAPADYVVAGPPAGTTAAAALRRAGFVLRAPGPRVLVWPFREGLRPDPCSESSWAFMLGDLEQLF